MHFDPFAYEKVAPRVGSIQGIVLVIFAIFCEKDSSLCLRAVLLFPHLINAATFASEFMLQAVYGNFKAQYRFEQVELVLTERFATRRSGANRAVVLDEQEAVAVVRLDFSHVSLFRSHSGQLLKLLSQRHSRGNLRQILRALAFSPAVEDLLKPFLTECIVHSVDQ